jgi:hypothetical protein
MADNVIRGYCSTPDTIFKDMDAGERAATWAGKAWEPGTTLTVTFLNSVGDYPDLVQQHVKAWEDVCSIKFKFTKDPGAIIRISFTSAPNQFYAYVGKDMLTNRRPDGHNMSLGFKPGTDYESATPGQVRGLILHEFGHALGLVHEHMRPEATGAFFQDRQKVYAYYARSQGWSQEKVDRNVLNIFSAHDIGNSTAFDPDSIMLYYFPPEITIRPTKPNFELSALDKKLIGQIYPKADEGPAGQPLTVGVELNAVNVLEGSEDLYNFEVPSRDNYMMETTGDLAWVLKLSSRSAPDTAIETADANVGGRNARISRTLDPGVYYLSVKNSSPDGAGAYGIVVRKGTA